MRNTLTVTRQGPCSPLLDAAFENRPPLCEEVHYECATAANNPRSQSSAPPLRTPSPPCCHTGTLHSEHTAQHLHPPLLHTTGGGGMDSGRGGGTILNLSCRPRLINWRSTSQTALHGLMFLHNPSRASDQLCQNTPRFTANTRLSAHGPLDHTPPELTQDRPGTGNTGGSKEWRGKG